ncbi:MAG: beta-L-arabinofuranosidase domain-containing protein [Prolixibacteraceae bacterium]
MMKRARLLLCVIGCFGLMFSARAQSQYPGQNNDKLNVSDRQKSAVLSFDLKDVKLLDSRFKENMEINGKWLLEMDLKRLMHSWKVNAGIASKAKALGGWETLDCELRGHTAGHVLSGLALMYASTGNEAFKKKGDSIVVIMAECQKVLNQEGYISAFPQNFVNRCIAGEGVWAPWYTLHKIMAGLTDMYLLTGNKQALDVAVKMSGWAWKKLKPLSTEQLAVMLKNEFGGMTDAAFNLYAITGNPHDRELGEFFYDHKVLDPLAKETDNLAKLHANTQIPKIIGEARGYELTGNESQKTLAKFFWQTVHDHHTYANGGNSDFEFFFAPDKLSEHLSACTTETCNTYNMLKLTRHLFSWTADAKYADYYEQALYNHILAAQDPRTGMASYFMPFKPGLFKVFSTPTNCFWCCVGTGFESNAKYSESIYYHDDNSLYVNLFIPSELSWKDKGIKITQETKFPEEASTRFTVSANQPVKVSLHFRYPSWAMKGATVKVNGKNFAVKAKPGSYIVVERKWKTGDKIELSYPMELRLVPSNDNPLKAAIAYGPVLLAGKMGKDGLKAPAPYAETSQREFNNYNIPSDLISSLNIHGGKIADWLKPVAGQSLTFKTTGVSEKDITMIPYYQLNDERYVIYWDLK